jgi:hypothetical protein
MLAMCGAERRPFRGARLVPFVARTGTPPIVLIKPRPFIHGSSLFVRMSTSALARTCATIKTRSLQDA